MTDRTSQRVVPRPLVGVGDLLTGTRRAWYIPDEVPVGLSVLLGNEGSGKSTLAVDYAFRIARDFPVVMMGGDGQAFYVVSFQFGAGQWMRISWMDCYFFFF